MRELPVLRRNEWDLLVHRFDPHSNCWREAVASGQCTAVYSHPDESLVNFFTLDLLKIEYLVAAGLAVTDVTCLHDRAATCRVVDGIDTFVDMPVYHLVVKRLELLPVGRSERGRIMSQLDSAMSTMRQAKLTHGEWETLDWIERWDVRYGPFWTDLAHSVGHTYLQPFAHFVVEHCPTAPIPDFHIWNMAYLPETGEVFTTGIAHHPAAYAAIKGVMLNQTAFTEG